MNIHTTVGDYLRLNNRRLDQYLALLHARCFDEADALYSRIKLARRMCKGGCFATAYQILAEKI